jgi:hypothetical protein
MTVKSLSAVVALFSTCAPAFAQIEVLPPGHLKQAQEDAAAYNAAHAPAATPPTVAAPALVPVVAQTQSTSEAVLHVGTEVPLKLSEELTTKGKKLRLGQRFRMETTAPVIVRGLAAIPVGSPAVGEITEVRNKGGWGKSGHFTGQIPLRVRQRPANPPDWYIRR